MPKKVTKKTKKAARTGQMPNHVGLADKLRQKRKATEEAIKRMRGNK